MPLPPKVKSRIGALASLGLAVFLACIYTGYGAGEKPKPKSLGERAITAPAPPVIVPPLLKNTTTAKLISIHVDLSTQRLKLLVDGKAAIDTPVSTGRRRLETPTGKFFVKDREARRKASDYGDLVAPGGKTVVAGVYRDRDPVPSGLRFRPAPREHILTVEEQNFILHAGAVGGLPVSDGAIIIPPEIAKILVSKVPARCLIEIVAGGTD